MLNALFVGQSCDDIRRKLQKLQGWETQPINTHVDLAFKVFLNRDKEEKKQDLKSQSVMLAKVVQGGQGQKTQSWKRGQRGAPQKLGKDQCSFCFEIGHWRRDCPHRAAVTPQNDSLNRMMGVQQQED